MKKFVLRYLLIMSVIATTTRAAEKQRIDASKKHAKIGRDFQVLAFRALC
jgi:hypothetical protein